MTFGDIKQRMSWWTPLKLLLLIHLYKTMKV